MAGSKRQSLLAIVPFYISYYTCDNHAILPDSPGVPSLLFRIISRAIAAQTNPDVFDQSTFLSTHE